MNSFFFDRLPPSVHWAVRIALGSVFLYHGITKFPVLSGMAEMMGMPVFVVGLLAAIFMVYLPNGWNSVSMDQVMEFQFPCS